MCARTRPRALFGLLAAGLVALEVAGQEGDASRLFEEGLAHYQRKDYAVAIDRFTQALLRRPHDREIQKYVIATGQFIVDQESHQKTLPISELQRIVDQAQKILEQRHREMEGILERLKDAHSQSQLQDPKALLGACRGVDLLLEISLGEDPESRKIRGYLHSICENLKKAVDGRILADKEAVHRVLGYIAFCRSQWIKAAQEWEKAAVLNPQDSRLRELLFQARARHKREILQKQITGLMDAAKEKLKAKMHREATATFESVLRLHPTHEEALGLLEKTQSRIREDARKASIHANRELALDRQAKRSWIEAAQYWLNILELDPLHAEARRNLTKIRSGLARSIRNLAEPLARAHPDKNKPADPQKSQELYTLGLLNYSEGNLAKAIDNFKESLELNPSNEFAEKALKRVERELQIAP